MNNNDILRRIRYALDLSDTQLVEIFALKEIMVSVEEVVAFMGKPEESHTVECPDSTFAGFLDGLILQRRGPRENEDSSPAPLTELNNNAIFKKLRIALSLHEKDVLAALAAGGMKLSKGELSALFRHPAHKHYRPCGDQILRNFLNGLTRLRRSPQPAGVQTDLDNPWLRNKKTLER